MPKLKDPIDELAEKLNRSPSLFTEKMNALARAILFRNPGQVEDATDDLGKLLAETMALADLIGRRRLMMEKDAAERKQRKRFHDDFCIARFMDTDLFPDIEFKEAFDDIISRDPRLAPSAEEIRRVYGAGGFAVKNLPKSLSNQARLNLTARIQSKIASMMQGGTPVPEASEVLAEMGDFSRHYAENIYRTNLATAYSAGRFRQMSDPDVAEVIPSFEFEATMDADTRKKHAAANGMIAPLKAAVWDVWTPPVSWQCRCALRSVDVFELQERGLLVRGKAKEYFPRGFDPRPPDPKFRAGRGQSRAYFRDAETEEQIHPLDIYV